MMTLEELALHTITLIGETPELMFGWGLILLPVITAVMLHMDSEYTDVLNRIFILNSSDNNKLKR